MTQDDKILLLHFITRTAMYVHPVEENTIVSFIHGYESGTQNKCDYTILSRKLFSEKYKTSYSNDGWPAQIKRYAEKRSLTWIQVFKNTTLEIIVNESNGKLDGELKKIYKKRIANLIDHFNTPHFNSSSSKEWLELIPEKSKWFDEIWSNEELKILMEISEEFSTGNIYSDSTNKIASEKLLKLREQFKSLKK